MIDFRLALIAALLTAGCASAPPKAHNGSGQLVPVASLEVCEPEIQDKRAAMSASCINRVEHSPTVTSEYRIKRKRPNPCDRIISPNCR